MRCSKCVKNLQHGTIPSQIWDFTDINAKNILAYLITFLSPPIRYLSLRLQHISLSVFGSLIANLTTPRQSHHATNHHHSTPVCMTTTLLHVDLCLIQRCKFVLVDVGLGCGFVWFDGFGMWVCECGGLLWIFFFFFLLRWHW